MQGRRPADMLSKSGPVVQRGQVCCAIFPNLVVFAKFAANPGSLRLTEWWSRLGKTAPRKSLDVFRYSTSGCEPTVANDIPDLIIIRRNYHATKFRLSFLFCQGASARCSNSKDRIYGCRCQKSCSPATLFYTNGQALHQVYTNSPDSAYKSTHCLA